MNYYVYDSVYYSVNELCHFGVKGMKWGVRRYQNKDGTLTEEGKKRVSEITTRDVDEAIYYLERMGLV